MIDLFFAANPDSAQGRASFTAAFPSFPTLGETESIEWLLINMKKPDQDHIGISAGQQRYNLDGDENRRKALAKVQMPSNDAGWVVENRTSTKYTRRIEVATARDLECEVFREDIHNIAEEFFNIFAADVRMKFS